MGSGGSHLLRFPTQLPLQFRYTERNQDQARINNDTKNILARAHCYSMQSSMFGLGKHMQTLSLVGDTWPNPAKLSSSLLPIRLPMHPQPLKALLLAAAVAVVFGFVNFEGAGNSHIGCPTIICTKSRWVVGRGGTERSTLHRLGQQCEAGTQFPSVHTGAWGVYKYNYRHKATLVYNLNCDTHFIEVSTRGRGHISTQRQNLHTHSSAHRCLNRRLSRISIALI